MAEMASKLDQPDDTGRDSTELENLMKENSSNKADQEVPDVKSRDGSDGGRAQKIIVGLIVFLGIVCLAIGITLVILAKSKTEECEKRSNEACKDFQNTTEPPSSFCSLSKEAQRIGLNEFLSKVRNKFYELHPNMAVDEPKASRATILKRFRAYDPSPKALKLKTDSALALLQEIKNKSVDEARLKLREKKALPQIKFFLKHNFGQPWDTNYYKGEWMLGPNFFCWMPICDVPKSLGRHLPFFKPRSLKDLDLLKQMLKGYKAMFEQYMKNMKLGVKSGMVRSMKECKAGLDALKAVYPEVARSNATGNQCCRFFISF